uniref:Cytochrome P450 2D6-like n=1 Tax=Podarcis muralis TaxID=64176 RepID=A0A670K658_PODMU|nr:cytochrome P450 2D6-like [Podarcis muralis]
MEPFHWVFSMLMAIWNNLTLLVILFSLLTLSFDFMKRRKPWRNYPPGPISLPFIGTLLQIDMRKPHLSFTQLSKKYGNIYSLQAFYTNVVVVNGFKLMKEALVHKSEDFADRPDVPVQSYLSGYKQGLVFAKYNHAWKEQRRFLVSNLRDFGMGKKSLEWRMIEEAGHLCSAFRAEGDHPFDPQFIINNAVSNVIASMTFGYRFDYKDQKFQELLHLFEDCIQDASGLCTQLINMIPCLLHIPPLEQIVSKHQMGMYNYIENILKVHVKTWDSSCRRDIIDAFLEEIEKRKKDVKTSFNHDILRLIITELFAAGTETVATTLRWGLLYMIQNPEVQSKVQKEIDDVIGKNRSATMGDQASMPYTHAVINEIQRFADVSPLMLPHMAYRDTTLQGFFIPKGTTVIFNLSSVLKDETVWEKPYEFYPEHFLNKKGEFVKREGFLPFSAGLRVCPGEQLARTELFLFLTSLLQHFTFCFPENQSKPQQESRFSLTVAPPPLQIQAIPR